jgi:4-hydroxybenzoate polyprenyltransferase
MRAYLQLARPPQWVKNVFVLAGLVAGGSELIERGSFVESAGLAGLAFVGFCLVSSACYVINDLLDREEDRHHPTKRLRPLASGAVTPTGAILFSIVLAAVGMTCGVLVGARGFLIILIAYYALTNVYSVILKHLILLDVISISTGFVLRAWGGAIAVDVPVSPWLIVCTFTLCLFLGFGKRRCELAVIGDSEKAKNHRATLEGYTIELLNHLLSISAGIAVITFLLYAMDVETERKFGTNYLIYTTPLVVYGVFRYAMLIESGRIAGPTDIMLNDRPFVGVVILWVALTSGIIYKGKSLKTWLEGPPQGSQVVWRVDAAPGSAGQGESTFQARTGPHIPALRASHLQRKT